MWVSIIVLLYILDWVILQILTDWELTYQYLLDAFGWESMALLDIRLSHERNTGRSGINLCGLPPVNNKPAVSKK